MIYYEIADYFSYVYAEKVVNKICFELIGNY